MLKPASLLRGDRLPLTLSSLILVLGIVVLTARMPLLYDIQQRLEWFAYDLRMRLNLPNEMEFDPQVVIVDIDEKSLAAEGQWPWARRRIADLVEAISGAGAMVVAFDSTFPEPERNPIDQVLETGAEGLAPEVQEALAAQRESMDGDLYLSGVFAANPVVLGFTFTTAEVEGKGELPASSVHYEGDPDRVSFLRMETQVGNLPALQASATASGFFSVVPDADGVIRRVPTVIRHGDTLYASLAVEAMRMVLGAESVEVITEPVGDTERIDHLSIGGMLDIPTDGEGQVIVPFKGRSPRFLYLSATDVLNGRVDASAMEGSVVLVGTTAEGLKDLRATPVQAVYPGVEVHATTISALFGSGFPVRPAWALGADVAVLALSGIAAIVLFARLGLLWSIFAALLLLGAVAGLNFWLWSAKQLVLSLAAPVLSLLAIILVYLGFRFLEEARSRRGLKEAFGQYVPATLVEEMFHDPDKDFGFEGESREMSVLFSDIRGFTTLSEKLDPQGLKQFLNAYFTPITEIIFRKQGTIDKYVGDMVMAFWGAPLRDHAHAQNAVETALAMLDAMPKMREDFGARGWPEVDIGIGINTGPMNVGDMGSSFRRAYTVIGDAVNLGSRLESLTKYYGVRLLVSDSTRAAVTGVTFRRLDRVQVKGKSEPIEIHEAVCLSSQLEATLAAELEAHEAALDAYFAGDWDAAAHRFSALASAFPERLVYGVFVERVAELRQTQAPGWDGVYAHTAK
jgi:adenylate cyclase